MQIFHTKYRSSEPKTEPEAREYIDNIFMKEI